MWIQEWYPQPRLRYFRRYGIWKEHDSLYLSVWRTKGPGKRATFAYWVTQDIFYDAPMYRPVITTKSLITHGEIDYRGHSKDLNKLWKRIMANPTVFLIRGTL